MLLGMKMDIHSLLLVLVFTFGIGAAIGFYVAKLIF